MSQGNQAAMIGLVNTSKIPMIGAYTQGSTPPPGMESAGPYIGVNGSTYYDRNVMGEDFAVSGGLLAPADSGAASGKNARWVSNTASLTVAADGLCAVSAGGVVTALATTGTYKTFLTPGAVIPANSFFWVFEV